MEFVCDFCDNPVGVNDEECENCGASFSDVRCPSCDTKGSPKDFKKGCPNCGSKLFVLYSHQKKDDIIDMKLSIIIMIIIVIPLMLLGLSRIL